MQGGCPSSSGVPFDFRVNMFAGTRQSVNDPTVEEWVNDVKCLFKSWQTPADQQPQLLLKYLSGEANREVLIMEVAERVDSRTVMERLIKIYGDKTPTSSLLQKFHCRQQRETETVREFFLALQEIVGRLKRRDPDAVAKPDEMLRDRFVLGLRDGDIRRAIKVDLKFDLKFEDVRSEALHQAADQGESAAVNVASVVAIPSPSIVLGPSDHFGENCTAATGDVGNYGSHEARISPIAFCPHNTHDPVQNAQKTTTMG